MSEPIDMSSFEAEFDDPNEPRYSNLMPNDDFDRLAFLNVRIDDIALERELLDDEASRLEKSQAEINRELAELRKRVDELLVQRRPVDDAIAKFNRIARHNKSQSDAYERERQRLLEELLAQRKFLMEQEALETKTKDYPWRVGVPNAKGEIVRALKHQLAGAHRLVAAERGILGDSPGLGKTLEAIITIDLLRAKGKGKKVLIFTPKQVLPDFERAFKRWTNPTFVHVLNESVRGVKIKANILSSLMHFPEMIVITNYEVWRKDISIHEALIDCGFDTIFTDEGHILNNEKSATTRRIRELIYAENLCPQCRSQSIGKRGLASICLSCGYAPNDFGEFCSVKNFYDMTGTPILNKPEDLFPPLNMIDREGFPDRQSFLNDYCVKEYHYGREQWVWTFGSGGSKRLLKKLGMKFTARTRESAGVVMPPQEVKHHWLELDPEEYPRQHKFISLLRDRAKVAFSEEHEMTTQGVFAWYTRMRQAASWPDSITIKGCKCVPECVDEYGLPGNCENPVVVFPPPDAPPIGESILMDTAERITCEAVEDGDRIVVFSMFKKVIAELQKRCEEKGLRVGVITGDVAESKRREYIDDFNLQYTRVGEHKYDVLICQFQTAQTGLNLTGAQQLLCIEREWNPGKEGQTLDRIRRLDSEFNSIVHILHCEGTATELIDAILDQKKAMLDGFQNEVDLVDLREQMRKFLEG